MAKHEHLYLFVEWLAEGNLSAGDFCREARRLAELGANDTALWALSDAIAIAVNEHLIAEGEPYHQRVIETNHCRQWFLGLVS